MSSCTFGAEITISKYFNLLRWLSTVTLINLTSLYTEKKGSDTSFHITESFIKCVLECFWNEFPKNYILLNSILSDSFYRMANNKNRKRLALT